MAKTAWLRRCAVHDNESFLSPAYAWAWYALDISCICAGALYVNVQTG